MSHGVRAAINPLVREALEDLDRVAAAVADEATANASDLATAIALANALKTKVNALLAALRAAGLMDS